MRRPASRFRGVSRREAGVVAEARQKHFGRLRVIDVDLDLLARLDRTLFARAFVGDDEGFSSWWQIVGATQPQALIAGEQRAVRRVEKHVGLHDFADVRGGESAQTVAHRSEVVDLHLDFNFDGHGRLSRRLRAPVCRIR